MGDLFKGQNQNRVRPLYDPRWFFSGLLMHPSLILERVRELRSSAFFQDIAWLFSGSVMAQSIGVAIMPLASRIYAPGDFAIASLIVLIVGFFTVVLTCRFELLVQLPKADNDAWDLVRSVVILGLWSSILLTPVFWLWGGPLAHRIGHTEFGSWLIIVPVTAAALACSTALQGWNQRKGLFRKSAFSDICSKLGYATSVIGGHWILPGAGGLVLATFGAHATRSAALSSCEHPKWRIWHPGCLRNAIRSYGQLAGSLMFSHLCLACTVLIPAAYISHAYDPDTLGNYSLALQTLCLPEALISNAIGQVYYQRIADNWAHGVPIRAYYQANLIRLLLIGIPLFSLIVLGSPWLFPVIFGHQWHEAGRYASLLAIAACGSFLSAPLTRTCMVVGAWWYLPSWNLLRLATTLVVVWIAGSENLEPFIFLVLLTCQQCTLFAIDIAMQFIFARNCRHS